MLCHVTFGAETLSLNNLPKICILVQLHQALISRDILICGWGKFVDNL